MGRAQDDDKGGHGKPGETVAHPDAKRAGEEPGPRNTTFGGGQQPKASKKQNFKGGDASEQDTHK